MRSRLVVAAIGLVIIGGGVTVWHFVLRPPGLTDRQQILRMVAELEQAVEQRQTSTVMRYISEDYRDGHGFDRRMIQRLVVQAARQRSPIDIVVQLGPILIEGDTATARVDADYSLEEPLGEGMGTHVSAEVVFRRERGGWRVLRADGWQGPALEM